MPDAPTAHAGSFKKLGNISADSAGSIHDDAPAQALGFRGAFVPGSVVGTKALLAATALLGDRWFANGSYDLTFVSPVYEDEEVREAGELNDGGAFVRVESPDGRLCCSGRVTLGSDSPWDVEQDGQHGAEHVLPDVPIGLDFGQSKFSVSWDDVIPICSASGDDSDWYQSASPFGGPIIPPERLQRVALDLTRTKRLSLTGVRMPGMWAGHALVIREPLFMNRPYRMRERVADKGMAGRAVYLTYEFTVADESGREVAVGRHKVKWLAE